jgi:hypothetical protein
MLIFILKLACILTAAVIGQQYSGMQRVERAHIRKNESCGR